MAYTPDSSSTSFATPAELIQFRDWRKMAEWISDDGTIPTQVTFLASPIVSQCLLAETGEIETAASVGARYRREDLAALSGAALVKLKQLCCDICFGILARRRLATIQTREISGLEEAYDLLEKLKMGERIFPYIEVEDAGNMDTTDVVSNYDYNNPPISIRAERFFGWRNGRWPY